MIDKSVWNKDNLKVGAKVFFRGQVSSDIYIFHIEDIFVKNAEAFVRLRPIRLYPYMPTVLEKRLSNVQPWVEPVQEPIRPAPSPERSFIFSLSRERIWSDQRVPETEYSSTFKMRKVLNEVFKINHWELSNQVDTVVICSGSQFAEFIIKRNEVGLQNGIKELRLTELNATKGPHPRVIDARFR